VFLSRLYFSSFLSPVACALYETQMAFFCAAKLLIPAPAASGNSAIIFQLMGAIGCGVGTGASHPTVTAKFVTGEIHSGDAISAVDAGDGTTSCVDVGVLAQEINIQANARNVQALINGFVFIEYSFFYF